MVKMVITKFTILLIFFILLLGSCKSVFALTLQETLDDLAISAWQTDDGVVISKDQPKFFKTCKNIKRTKGEIIPLTTSEYSFERMGRTIEIKNNLNFWGKGVTLKFRRSGLTNITEKVYFRLMLRPQNWSFSKLSLSSTEQIGEVISVQLHFMDRVICTSFYSVEELKNIENIKLEEKRAISKANALRDKIYNNCIQDKLTPPTNKEYRRSVIANCERISKAPNLWNRIKYGFIMQ